MCQWDGAAPLRLGPSGSAGGLNRLLRVRPDWFPPLPWTQRPRGLFPCLPAPGLRAPPPATRLSLLTLPLAPPHPPSGPVWSCFRAAIM